MALGVDGVRVGVWTSPSGASGCTVVLPPDGTLGALAVRGAAPGTREAAALGPGGKLTVCHAVVLAGGSAFGLAAADGAVRWLEERGVGYPVRPRTTAGRAPGGPSDDLAATIRVPIVGAAIVLDESVADRANRPGPEAGYAACDAATTADPPEGSVGAGRGCSVGKTAGLEHAWRGGQGVAVRRAAGVTVGALVVNNAVGDVVAEDGSWLARSRAPDHVPRYPETAEVPPLPGAGGPIASTVIGCVVTDARLDKAEAVRVADLAHSGVARALRPAHTSLDGDALFCLATGAVAAHVDLVAALAADAVADACRRAVLTAEGHSGLPAVSDRDPPREL